ncbi:uncharacterized protein F5147DRAFT_651522 [Suillus discolor]|uniref:Uncharacterized protein n=1 Tax=Suillus discolor TaxID=1912936 RepID=A0A9P7FAY1_9AGAM|nr:uncharacterized protein F5147DRAFT_651522 [Suillus discolor]KAG2111347.1 hypothetical protein F5147DRAFT_651522 [Suillus discolor]
MSSIAKKQDLEFTLKDFTQIFEHAGSRLLIIRIELEKTKLTISPDDRGQLNFQAYTLPWMAFCARLSINPPLSKHLCQVVDVVSMKQLSMMADYMEVYDSFLSLPVSPSGPWTKGHLICEYRHAWFLTTYPDCHEVKECVTAHFAQLFEGDALVTPATSVEAMSTPIAQQLATICAEAGEEGQYLLKMLEDKVIEAKMVVATMLRMDTSLGDDVLNAITASEKLVKYLKQEATDNSFFEIWIEILEMDVLTGCRHGGSIPLSSPKLHNAVNDIAGCTKLASLAEATG